MTIAGLELVIEDTLEDTALPTPDRQVFETVRTILKTARRSQDVQQLQKNVIVLETRKRKS